MYKELTAENFEREMLNSDLPVMVDFYGVWCKPCMMLSPVMDELQNELEGKAYIYKIDVEDMSEVANKYQVKSLPCVLFFKDGFLVDRLEGAYGKYKYLETLEKLF